MKKQELKNLSNNEDAKTAIIDNMPKPSVKSRVQTPINSDSKVDFKFDFNTSNQETSLIEDLNPIVKPIVDFDESKFDLKLCPEPFEETEWIKFNICPKIDKTFKLYGVN